MRSLAARLFITFVIIATSLGTIGRDRPIAYAASASLVWYPYLQQVTETSAIVLWTTRSGSDPVVRYSTDTGYAAARSGTTRRLAALGTQLHRVALTGLQPDKRYYYRIETAGENLLPGATLSFRTAPRTGSATPFTFLALGDYGKNTTSQQRLRDQMQRDTFDFIVTTGDNAYESGTYSEFDTNVFQIYREVFSRGGLWPSLGNHEYETADAAPYLDLFDLPQQSYRAGERERYYAFDYGNAHVVVLDSNAPLDVTDSAARDDMLDWLRADLSATTQPWKIALLHHPPYNTGTSHGSDSRVLTKLVPIFEQYGVNLVLTGHEHIYERTYPIRRGELTSVEAGGIVYIVSGAGSAASYGCGTATWVAISYCAETYGIYNRITVDGDVLTIEALDDTGVVKDRVTLNRPVTSSPAPTPPSTPAATRTPLPTSTITSTPVESTATPLPSAVINAPRFKLWLPVVAIKLSYSARATLRDSAGHRRTRAVK